MTQRNWRSVRVAAIALLLATAAGHRAVTVARAAMPMEEEVKGAKTAGDHEALAADYDRMAADAPVHATQAGT